VITFDRNENRFKYRVAGAIIHDDHVLLTRAEGDEYWILPGGRVELHEDTRATLRREMREELDCEVELGSLLWIIENFFSLGDRRYHELSFIYDLMPANPEILDPTWTFTTTDGGTTIFFQWFPLNHLKEVNLKPEFLKHYLQEPPPATRHLIIRE
jgi:ADP-ribose pyrophosphatase YjhB (NUDIX family)